VFFAGCFDRKVEVKKLFFESSEEETTDAVEAGIKRATILQVLCSRVIEMTLRCTLGTATGMTHVFLPFFRNKNNTCCEQLM